MTTNRLLTLGSLNVLAFAVLAIPSTACKHGGGGSPCPEYSTTILRLADGTPAGRLNIAADADGLTVDFRPMDGRRFDGAYLVGTPDGEFRLFPESADDGRLVVAWDGIADDICGRTITIAVESMPTETITFSVACHSGFQTEDATDTGGGGGGGGLCHY